MAIDVERLIECVQSNVFLYDILHVDYKNTSRKQAVWEKIAAQLNENSETVKLKWKTVRDGYIKYKKLQKEGKKVNTYIWSTQLQFLDDYQVSRKSKKHKKPVTGMKVETLSDDESDTPSQTYSPSSVLIPSQSDSAALRKEQTPRRKRKTHNQPSNVNCLKTKKSKKINVVKYYDATDHLFLSYAQTFKTFSLRQQALLKVELANLFSNAELNALDSAMSLQESYVAGSSPGFPMGKNYDNIVVSADIHTVDVDDEESDDDEIEFVNPIHANGKRHKRSRTPSDNI